MSYTRFDNNSVAISGWQYFSIISAGNKAHVKVEQYLNNNQAYKLPAFTITDIASGKTLQSSSFKGKVLLINFWASWARSAESEAFIGKIYKEKLNDNNVLILTILHNDNAKDALNSIKAKGIAFPIYAGVGNQVSRIFNIAAVPETILIDKNGTVIRKTSGEKSVMLLNETNVAEWSRSIRNLQ